MRIARTSDVLHINDSTYFLMDRSPLEKFPDYKKLYEKYKDKKVEHVHGFFYGMAIRPDKTTNYSAIWYLNDSLLFLSDIDFFLLVDKVENVFPNNEQYRLMEELTGAKFDTIYENHTRYTYKEHKHDRSITYKLINPFGAMPATWFSDTLIVKRAAKYSESLDEWENEPCRELIFEKGRLISDRIMESVEDTYDLDFESYAESYRGEWTNIGRMIKFALDSTEMINNKFPLKISSINTRNRGGEWDEKKEMLFSRTITLPRYKYGDTCTVSINSKSENMANWKFEIRGLDENEHILFADSAYIESASWKVNSISFPLRQEKALRIIIAFTDEHPKENQHAWIDRIRISIGDKDINTMELTNCYGGFSTDLNEDYVTPLSFSEDHTILKIPEIKDKQIIGLGECTHGSQDVKEACYQFMRALISEYNCKAVLFERAPDMCLKWDLYVNGLTPEEVGRDIEVETRGFFDDAGSFVDFLKWLRRYNETSQSKVHIFGFDAFGQPHLFLYDYFKLILGEEHSQPYLRLLNDEDYKGVTGLASVDSRLRSILDTKDFDYLLFLLEESARTRTIFEENDEREIDMGRRADKIIQLYLKAGDKAVIHAHTSHTNKGSDFFFDVVEKPSMGNYIYRKYGDKYFSIGFQAGEGLYTQDDMGLFSETVTDTLQTPIPISFEYSALKVNNPYFYYPTDKLPDGIFNIRVVLRERKNLNQFFFCSIKKRFNGLVFIRDNSQLHDIEAYPAFYTNGLMQFKDRQQRGLLSDSKESKRD